MASRGSTLSSSRSYASLVRSRASFSSNARRLLIATAPGACGDQSRPVAPVPPQRHHISTVMLRLAPVWSTKRNFTPSLSPKASAREIQQWFREVYPPLIALPDDVLLQAVTHESFDHGMSSSGHNRRLGFVGRRAMHMFLAIFLSRLPALATAAITSSASSSTRFMLSADNLEQLLDTRGFGDSVGRALKLEEVMRWTPAVSDGQRGPRETGLFKIRGSTVEALVGALYHQHGAAIARAFFHSQILPLLSIDQDNTRLADAIEAEAETGHTLLTSARSADAASSGDLVSLSHQMQSAQCGCSETDAGKAGSREILTGARDVTTIEKSGPQAKSAGQCVIDASSLGATAAAEPKPSRAAAADAF